MTFMEAAISEACVALNMGEVPVGAAIVRGDKVIARAHNLCENTHDPTAHAELLAIRAAAEVLGDWRLKDCEMYVTLEPCAMCAGAIVNARISRLYFGAYDRAAGCSGSVYRITEDPAFNHFCPATGGIMIKECGSLLRTFFAIKRGDSR